MQGGYSLMAFKSKVLLVDDEEIIRDSLSEWLESDGFSVITAENGMEALKKYDTEQPVVAVVDIKMPGMDGVTLLKKLKEKNRELPVIIMTAFATVENAVQSMKDGAYDFICKPFPPEKLSNLLSHILEHQDLQRENVKLQKERKHILHIAITALVSFMVLMVLIYLLAIR
ncbi:response regulator [candidate division KSB1 bacterium]|nr:response regulator [candidate division KSB1 bacterium]